MKPDKCPKCEGAIVAVEYSLLDPNHYDGTSEWACVNAYEKDGKPPTCDWRIGRFCGQRLQPKESEPAYCKGIHPTHA